MTIDELRALKPCQEALDWIGERTPAEAWLACERGDRMLWLLCQMIESGPPWPDQRALVLIGCDCAELAREYWCDDQPRVAIETAQAEATAYDEAVRDFVKHQSWAATAWKKQPHIKRLFEIDNISIRANADAEGGEA